MRIRSFAGLIPPALIPSVRSYLTSQGIRGQAVDDQGNIDPQAILALAYKELEFRSRLTPTLTYDLTNTDTRASTRALTQAVQPAVIGIDRAGNRTVLFAPYGIPSGIAPQAASAGTSIGLGIGAAVLGLLLIGAVVVGPKLTKRR